MSATVELHLNSTQRPIGSLGAFDWVAGSDGPWRLEPDAFDEVPEELGSVYARGGWADLVRLHPYSPQLTADPLPRMNQTVSKGVQIAAVCVMTTGTVMGANWGIIQPPPATVVGWDDAAQSITGHPTMCSPEVASYLQAARDEDITTLRALYDRFTAAFGDAPHLEASYRFSFDHETENPLLFLTLDTHGMDLEEVMLREMAVHELIAQDPVLKAATKNHIITAV